jgi:hypothetical protein
MYAFCALMVPGPGTLAAGTAGRPYGMPSLPGLGHRSCHVAGRAAAGVFAGSQQQVDWLNEPTGFHVSVPPSHSSGRVRPVRVQPAVQPQPSMLLLGPTNPFAGVVGGNQNTGPERGAVHRQAKWPPVPPQASQYTDTMLW